MVTSVVSAVLRFMACSWKVRCRGLDVGGLDVQDLGRVLAVPHRAFSRSPVRSRVHDTRGGESRTGHAKLMCEQ